MESIDTYLDRLDGQFDANKIVRVPAGAKDAAKAAADKEKVSSLISIIGAEPYRILENLCKPQKPKDKKFEELSTLLVQHYKPPVLCVHHIPSDCVLRLRNKVNCNTCNPPIFHRDVKPG